MATITISLPDEIANHIDQATKKGGFATRSEFIRDLVRKFLASKTLKQESYDPIPLDQVRADLQKSGKYSKAFIESVVSGLSKSSVYEN